MTDETTEEAGAEEEPNEGEQGEPTGVPDPQPENGEDDEQSGDEEEKGDEEA